MPNKTPERWNAPKSANHKQGHTTTGYRLSQTGSTSRGNNLGMCVSRYQHELGSKTCRIKERECWRKPGQTKLALRHPTIGSEYMLSFG